MYHTHTRSSTRNEAHANAYNHTRTITHTQAHAYSPRKHMRVLIWVSHSHIAGGTISATSEVGKGTAFTIRLPFGCEHLPQEQIATAPLPPMEVCTCAQQISPLNRELSSHPLSLEKMSTPYTSLSGHLPLGANCHRCHARF